MHAVSGTATMCQFTVYRQLMFLLDESRVLCCSDSLEVSKTKNGSLMLPR